MNHARNSFGSVIARHTRSIGCGYTRTYSMVHRSMNRARSGLASSFFTFALRRFHSVEVCTQSVEARAACVDLRLHPLPRLVERIDFQPVDARLRFLPIRDQPALAQHLQMPRYRRIGDVEARVDFARRALTLR